MCYSALVKANIDFLKDWCRTAFVHEPMGYDDWYLGQGKSSAQVPDTLRIFPGSLAPIVSMKQGRLTLEWMKYGAYPPETISSPSKYTTYNARRDNLQSRFWDSAYLKHHGFVLISGFFEWVQVNDLLRSNIVSLDQVKAYFDHEMIERRSKVELAGKKWRLTPTEALPPIERKIMIQISPSRSQVLAVPVIFNHSPRSSNAENPNPPGFAIITDDPPPEVLAVGHDRCPIPIATQQLGRWIELDSKLHRGDLDPLGRREQVVFRAQLVRP
jgi:putative SOS response-associated peptidase YedK